MERKGSVRIEHLDKYYGDNHVINDVSLTVNAGEFLSFLGPSGCGKTTMLRSIGGFETIEGGDIFIDDESVIKLPPHKRKVNTIFQHYALFPHLNVYKNIAYGLRDKKMSKKEIDDEVEKALSLVQLDGFEKRMPSQMSGGQKQRVSIARAIVNHPSVLLLDEPLTALDMKLRKEMRYELRNLQKSLGITFIYVTHDQEEAMIMSDRIAVLNGGKIEQLGTPKEIYKKPVSPFVSDFIGETNAFDGVLKKAGNSSIVNCESGDFPILDSSHSDNAFVSVSIRPQSINWSLTPHDGFTLRGTVKDYIFTGSFINVVLELTNMKRINITRFDGEEIPKIGDVIFPYWDPSDAVVMANEGEEISSTIENIDLGSWVRKEGA